MIGDVEFDDDDSFPGAYAVLSIATHKNGQDDFPMAQSASPLPAAAQALPSEPRVSPKFIVRETGTPQNAKSTSLRKRASLGPRRSFGANDTLDEDIEGDGI